jgi:hypothetical protein
MLVDTLAFMNISITDLEDNKDGWKTTFLTIHKYMN